MRGGVAQLGDYYAAARIAGAPVPPPAIISRAVFIQGFSCMLTGFVGTANGTTAYNENIGAMQITRVGSRRVVQCGSAIIIVVALIGGEESALMFEMCMVAPGCLHADTFAGMSGDGGMSFPGWL